MTHLDKKIHTFCQSSHIKFHLRKRLRVNNLCLHINVVLLTLGLMCTCPLVKHPMNLRNCNIFYDKGPKSKVDEPRLAFTKFIFVAEKVGGALLLMLLYLLIMLAIGL
jgi:hypothetical protein